MGCPTFLVVAIVALFSCVAVQVVFGGSRFGELSKTRGVKQGYPKALSIYPQTPTVPSWFADALDMAIRDIVRELAKMMFIFESFALATCLSLSFAKCYTVPSRRVFFDTLRDILAASHSSARDFSRSRFCKD